MTYGDATYGDAVYGGGTVPNTHFPEHWIERLCGVLEIPFTHEIQRFFTAWARAEGGTARWNPLNTTNHVHSSSDGDWQGVDYNSIGVCNYNKAYQGILATADTMMESVYGSLITVLRNAKTNSTTAEQIVQQTSSTIKTWGTNPQTMLDVLKSIS